MNTKHTEATLKRLVDEREGIHAKHESKIAELNERENAMPNADERELLTRYRDQLVEYDEQIQAM